MRSSRYAKTRRNRIVDHAFELAKNVGVDHMCLCHQHIGGEAGDELGESALHENVVSDAQRNRARYEIAPRHTRRGNAFLLRVEVWRTQNLPGDRSRDRLPVRIVRVADAAASDRDTWRSHQTVERRKRRAKLERDLRLSAPSARGDKRAARKSGLAGGRVDNGHVAPIAEHLERLTIGAMALHHR